MRPPRSTRICRISLFPGALTGVLLGLGLLAGCAPVAQTGQDMGPTIDSDPGYHVQQPTLLSIAPSAVALGDLVTVFGKDFIDPQHGQLSLHMVGSFTNAAGAESRWEGDMPLTYVSPGKATFEFGPSVFFSSNGQELGTYNGSFQAVSKLTVNAANAPAGDVEVSDVLPLAMTALPSIYIEQLRSVDDNCALVTSGTTAGSNLALGVRALGMDPGTPTAPLTFSFTFKTPDVAAAFVNDQPYTLWPPSIAPGTMIQAQDGTHTISFPVTNDNAAIIDPQHSQQVVDVSPPVLVNQANVTTVKLARFAAGMLTDEKDTAILNIVVAATAADGTTMARTLNFPSYQALSLQPSDQIDKIKVVYPMTQTNCSSGGLTGQMYAYSEGASDSRTRNISMSASSQTSVGVDVNLFLARANANSTRIFGVDVMDSVTTESHTSFMTTINVLPSYVGASFRQPIETNRFAYAVLRNSCGVPTPVGTLVMRNWRWNYDVNQGSSCDDVQPSADALAPGPR